MSHDKAIGHEPVSEDIFPLSGPEGPGRVDMPIVAKKPVLSASLNDWRRWMVERGYPAYRARQMLDWIIRKRAESFELMSDLPRLLRGQLTDEWTAFGTRVIYHGVASDGADKLVLTCHDDRRIECVLMSGESRRTVCVSTQVGCGIGCVFLRQWAKRCGPKLEQ